MPSLEGLKTWFHYEVLITASVVVLLVAFVGLSRIATALELGRVATALGGLPLERQSFAIAITALGLGTILVLLWTAARLNETGDYSNN